VEAEVIVAFVGPTLPRREVDEALGGRAATVLPPAAQGDIYRAVRGRPSVIVLIDGYFHKVASVWHKEILWALGEGVPVIGAASMGALRAAELAPFGMIGVGAVYAAYRDGRLISDDEVVLAHGDESAGYRALSEPLVNIRATIDQALAEGVIGAETHAAALRAAVSMFYADRSYPAVLSRIRDRPEAGALRGWLRYSRVDQKALDAKEALRLAASCRAAAPTPSWLFERTAMWEEFVRAQGARSLAAHETFDDSMLGALKADPGRYRAVAVAAIARLLAVEIAGRHGRSTDADELMRTLGTLRHERDLDSPDRVDAWLWDNDLSVDELVRLLTAEAHLNWAIPALGGDLDPYILDQLRLSGEYQRMKRSAGAARRPVERAQRRATE
jgi:hypothetical protein